MKERFLDLIGSSYFIALIISLIILYFLPGNREKYKVELIKKEKNYVNRIYLFPDLNHDGKHEKIEIVKNFVGRIGILVYSNSRLIDQWNFDGEYVSNENPLIGDIDNDGLDELIIFSVVKDSIEMNCFNPFTGKYLLKNKKICKYKKNKNIVDCSVYNIGFSDNNKDKIKEIYFSITTAFSTYPRRIFFFDFVSGKLNTSPDNCAGIRNPYTYDFDNDGVKEIVFSSVAFGNCDSSRAVNDEKTWFMMFDQELNYKIEPVLTGYYPSVLYVEPFNVNGNNYVVTFNEYSGIENHKNELTLFDINGNVKKKKTITFNTEWLGTSLHKSNHSAADLFLIRRDGKIYQITSDLNLKLVNTLCCSITTGPFKVDLDQDGKNELVFISKNKETLNITRGNFSYPVQVEEGGEFSSCSYIADDKFNLLVYGKNYIYMYKYFFNPFYYLRYFFYSGVYLALFLIVVLIQKIQQIRIQKTIEEEKRVAELQMMGIKNQMNPHFTLNIMNSIGSLFYKQDQEQANYVFGKYSRLLRLAIINAESNSITIKNEIDYVETYTMLEQFRFDNKFEYKITIDDTIDIEQKIPKMLVHTFVENAIKHGLQHKKEKGKLEIEIGKTDKNIFIVIIDNGIGRKKAGEINLFSTGKGLQIMNQILELYFSLYQVKIDYQIIDLMEKDEATGTKIEIDIKY